MQILVFFSFYRATLDYTLTYIIIRHENKIKTNKADGTGKGGQPELKGVPYPIKIKRRLTMDFRLLDTTSDIKWTKNSRGVSWVKIQSPRLLVKFSLHPPGVYKAALRVHSQMDALAPEFTSFVKDIEVWAQKFMRKRCLDAYPRDFKSVFGPDGETIYTSLFDDTVFFDATGNPWEKQPPLVGAYACRCLFGLGGIWSSDSGACGVRLKLYELQILEASVDIPPEFKFIDDEADPGDSFLFVDDAEDDENASLQHKCVQDSVRSGDGNGQCGGAQCIQASRVDVDEALGPTDETGGAEDDGDENEDC